LIDAKRYEGTESKSSSVKLVKDFFGSACSVKFGSF
jgi:hypothetical protein